MQAIRFHVMRWSVATLAGCALAFSIAGSDPVAPLTTERAAASPEATQAVRDSVTTVYLVRHAERSASFVGTDPPLSEAGAQRALALAHTLADAGITAIYSTRYHRCQDTAKPLADSLGVTLRIADQADARALVERVREECLGGTALVIGHSDTVPAIVSAFAQIEVPPFASGEHDRLYVITLPAHGPARVIPLRYGDAIGATR